MFNKSSISALLLVGVLFLSACSDSSPDSKKLGKVYKIGVITPLSGEFAPFGLEQKNVLDYRVKEINDKNDFQVELVYQDGQCEVGAAAESMRKLVEDEKIQYVIGGLCSAATFAAAPYTKEKKVILLSATTSNSSLEGTSPRTMSLSYPVSLINEATARELAKYKIIATLSEKSLDSTTYEEDLDNLLYSQYKDLKIAVDEKVPPETKDFDEIMAKIKSSGAEILWLNPSTHEMALNMLKAVEKANLKIQLLGEASYNDPDVLSRAPQVVNGMIILDSPVVADAKFIDYRNQLMAEKGPMERINVFYTAATIDALDLLVKLISENNGDFDSIEKALTTGSFTGNIGKIYFGGKAFVQGLQVQKLLVKDNQAVHE